LLLSAHLYQSITGRLGGFYIFNNIGHISLGGSAVTIFLVLSGIVLELHYRGRVHGYFTFLLKRILRIYPIYYLCALFGFAVYIVKSWYDSGTVWTGLSKLGLDYVFFTLTGTYAFANRWGGHLLSRVGSSV